MKIAIIAGEASGDYLGSSLIKELSNFSKNIKFYGIGGPAMIENGFLSYFKMEDLSVRGYIEVIRRIPNLLKIRNKIKKILLLEKPDVFIGIDSPDFNLNIEHFLKKNKIKTIHYVSPSIWAWRRERLKIIKKSVDLVLSIFPFEKKIYQNANIPVSYIGHPLADLIPRKIDKNFEREKLKLPNNKVIITLLPGSRTSEVAIMSGILIRSAISLQKLYEKKILFLVPLITRETRIIFENNIHKEKHMLDFKILYGHSRSAMASSDGAIITSGTATLEAALLKCPMVITYKMPKISAIIMKKKALIPFVGLPNILLNELLVPEILQDEVNPVKIASSLHTLITNKKKLIIMKKKFNLIHNELKKNSSRNAARIIFDFINERT